MNYTLKTPLLPFLTSATHTLPMERQGTAKFAQDSSPDLGSLRPIVAQQMGRYDVLKR